MAAWRIFNGGLLAGAYAERPLGAPGTDTIRTLFSPESGVFPHLGHIRAMAINFAFAEIHGGECLLRFDDTDTRGELDECLLATQGAIRWLGFRSVRITYTSDNFGALYELAEQLIQDDGAYVCHCTEFEISASRGRNELQWYGGPRLACPHRNRPTSESLSEFRAMRDGKYAWREAVLRLKQDMSSGNPQMWDLVVYKIPLYNPPHQRTGKTWRCYPTRILSHCICDSIERISHSMYTTEFEQCRDSYRWLYERLRIYAPIQTEYGRLKIEGTVLSRNKVKELIWKGLLRGWDDPRLYTIFALRRRGVPQGAIFDLINELGVTKSVATLSVSRFDRVLRRYLETRLARLNVVLDPIPVVIENLADEHFQLVELPFAKDPAFGLHLVPFTKTVYIEREDFREVDSEDYFRLATGKAVGLLRVPYPILATGCEKDEEGRVTKVLAQYTYPDADGQFKKPKAYIHWIGETDQAGYRPIKACVRYFHPLFQCSDPEYRVDWMQQINHDSEQRFENALIEPGFREIQNRAPWPLGEIEPVAPGERASPETIRFQGRRTAYFCEDTDSSPDNIILNQIVSLKKGASRD